MKKIYKLFPLTWSFLAFLFLALSSCDKMDDIQREYAEKDEAVYLGKVDSIKYFAGFGRAKLTWYIGADPKVQRTIIYWNMRKDSIVKEFTRTGPGLQKDSIILENLAEGSTLFEFRNVNDAGETSLYSSATVTVLGTDYGDGLRARKLAGFDFDYLQSLYRLTLSPSVPGDSVIFSEIVYNNKLGEEKTITIDRQTEEVELVNFPDGGEFKFRTAFFPPESIDMVYNDFATFSAPTAVNESGVKISTRGNMASKYFDRNGENLYEWNAAGDLIIYSVNTDGSLTQTESFPSVVSRATYRDLFFYDDDKFIGITTGNAVQMLRIENGVATIARTPGNSDNLGAGFGMPTFLPTRGHFFSVAANTGDLRVWIARNDVTWGPSNGLTVGTGYTNTPLMLFNHQTILGVDEEGYLWSTPVSVTGVPGSKSRVGSGWDRFEKIVSIGTTLFGMEENGDFYAFPNFSATDKYWIIN